MSDPAGEPTSAVRQAVRELISAWMPTQRWFAGGGREAAVSVSRLAELQPSPQVTIWAAVVDYGGGETETYQVPLVSHAQPVESLEHVLLGTVDTEAGTRWIYDALHDRDASRAWLAGLVADVANTDGADDTDDTDDTAAHITAESASDGAAVRFVRFVTPDAIPVDEPSLVMSGEQSNTSLVFGDAAIMKVFRRLQPGVNPDIEIGGALRRVEAENVAALLGGVEADVDFGDGTGAATSLAMVQEYLTSATDGWVLATASVRDLLAEADLHADEAGGDFAGEAERLGAAVAATHADLARAFGTREAGADELVGRAEAMRLRLEHALGVVPELGTYETALRQVFAAAGRVGEAVTLQRIHGDLHLGQVLRTVYRWVLIDFEGEPMAAIDDRRAFDSPLRDVAGMLRSFEYAGHHRAADPGSDTQLAYRANEWSSRNRDAFCRGYADAAGTDPRVHTTLLRALEAEKAVYEAVYESRHRPTWLPIPLASLTRLTVEDRP